MASSPSQTLPGTQARRTGKLKKISLIPFVAILYAYCAGGPFDYEAMVSTSGPGMALLFILIVPWLFSVPMALASVARLHPRFGTPVLAIVTSTLFCSLLALGSVTQLIAIYAWMRSATSVLTLLSLWRLRRVTPETKRSFVVPGGKAGLAAVVVIPTVLFAWALINSDPASRLWGIACLALGPVAYYFAKRRQPVASSGAARVDVAPR